MKILLVAATGTEVLPFFKKINQLPQDNFEYLDHDFQLLITSVGMVATAFELGRTLTNEKFDIAINVGLAGAFNKDLLLGEVVTVREEHISELGAQDDANFLSVFEMGLIDPNSSPYEEGVLHPFIEDVNMRKWGFTQVKAITVNKVHGKESTIERTIQQYNPDIESMEGAAFFYGCAKAEVPAVQLRAISNYVEKRNRDKWEINLALQNLAEALKIMIHKLA